MTVRELIDILEDYLEVDGFEVVASAAQGNEFLVTRIYKSDESEEIILGIVTRNSD